jgi:hypothetical protein
MKNIKSFKLFESNTISNIEVENLINDILLDLKDINDGFSWKIEFKKPEHENRDFIWGRLYITCSDDVSKIHGWADVLDRLFSILIEEGLKIYDEKESFTEVKPGKINLSWKLSHIMNPMTFEYVDVKWGKEFVIKI